MSLTFQSIQSSSSGNCLVLRSPGTTLLIDCGIKTQRDCEYLLARRLKRPETNLFRGGELFGATASADALIVTHAHGDHIAYAGLRSLAKHGIPIHAHRHVIDHVRRNFSLDDWPCQPQLKQFGGKAFEIGDFVIEPMQVPHAPSCPTFGFVIRYQSAGETRKVVVCTDFHDPSEVADRFVDADFIFIEANHDPDLLRLRPNYASHFHMSNPKTARLLAGAVERSARPPRAVRLGHLSSQRNTEELALAAVREAFARRRIAIDFDLAAAPRYEPSEEVAIRSP